VLIELSHALCPNQTVKAWIARQFESWLRVPLRRSLGRDRVPDFPWVALALAGSVLATAVATGVFVHEISPVVAGRGSFGWPALRAGHWWTLGTSFLLTRDWFMATTMPVCLFLAISLYERRAGHVRAFWVAATGHVTGSVIVAIGAGAIGWSGQPILVRAAQNMDYGASMSIAAALGALASRTGDRRFRILVLAIAVLALPLHHQMADWGHIVAVPTGYLIDRVRRLRPSLALFGVLAAVTAVLTSFGPAAVDATADTLRFGDTGSSVSSEPGRPHGTVTDFTYEAGMLQHRPETAQVYLPAGLPGPRPVIIFLHDLPGTSNDWLAGASAAQVLDDQARASALPWSVGVFASFDGFANPAAGWSDTPGQRTLASVVDDLIPALARQFPNRVDPTTIAVVGVGRGADGALALPRDDRQVRYVVALDPATGSSGQSGHRAVLLERSAGGGWDRWRSELPGALQWLGSQGFGATPHAQGTRT
jgi:dienelactone hydrolase